MSAPIVRPHITYDELCRMVPEGTLCELVDGEVYRTPSPNLRHQTLVGRLFAAFLAAIRDGSTVIVWRRST